jgi:hypothetical protein
MLWTILLNVIALILLIAIAFGLIVLVKVLMLLGRKKTQGVEGDITPTAPPGYSVEVDCRKCGQHNRVPSERLRHKPKCGKCKQRLMPKYKVAVCRVQVREMEGVLRADIDKTWNDEDRFWDTVADHVALRAKDDRPANQKVVN